MIRACIVAMSLIISGCACVAPYSGPSQVEQHRIDGPHQWDGM